MVRDYGLLTILAVLSVYVLTVLLVQGLTSGWPPKDERKNWPHHGDGD